MPPVAPKTELREYAQRMKEARKAAGYSIMQVCIKTGVDKNTVVNIEHARYGGTIMKVAKLAKAYNVSMDWLVTGNGA